MADVVEPCRCVYPERCSCPPEARQEAAPPDEDALSEQVELRTDRARILAAFDLTEEDMAAFEATPEHQAYVAAREQEATFEQDFIAFSRAFAARFSDDVNARLRAEGETA